MNQSKRLTGRLHGLTSRTLALSFGLVLAGTMPALSAQFPYPDAPHRTFFGAQDHSGYGHVVLNAGDVNGDGYDDLLVSAPFADHRSSQGIPWEEAGRVELFYGSEQGLGSEPAWRYRGKSAAAHTGEAATAAGDLNGDGYDDIVVGQPGHRMGAGRVLAFYGGPNGPGTVEDWSLEGTQETPLGQVLSAVGDVDGDGYDDLLLGGNRLMVIPQIEQCPGHNSTHVTPTSMLFAGTPEGLSSVARRIDHYPQGSSAASQVGSVGDLDGDGQPDFAAAEPHFNGPDQQGRILISRGGPNALTPGWDWEILPPADERNENFGWVIASAGDVNGDGYEDLLVADPAWAHESECYFGGRCLAYGAAYVYAGTPTGPEPSPLLTIKATVDRTDCWPPHMFLGFSATGLGDLDGDGRAELAVGIPGGLNPISSYSGSVGLVDTTTGSLKEIHGEIYNEAGMGNSLATGDFNGDDCPDLILGMPALSGQERVLGAFGVYYCDRRQELPNLPLRTLDFEDRLEAPTNPSRRLRR